MGQLFSMWRNTRMVVLTAICAALYAALLIPFKVVPIIPGVTELRPANAVPIVCAFLFGPAAAWGAALGNLIAEFFGGLGPGDVFGCLANLAFGLIPYVLWDACTDAPPTPRTAAGWAGLVSVIVLSTLLCATIIGWGIQLLGFRPFAVTATLVLVNNLIVAGALGPLLLRVLYPRVQGARLLYRDVLGPPPPRAPWRRALGVGLVVAGILTAFAAGEAIGAGVWRAPWAPWRTPSGAREIGVGLLPFLGLVVAGLGCL